MQRNWQSLLSRCSGLKRWLPLVMISLLLVMQTVASAAPAIPPKPTSNIYVQDYAGVLTASTEKQLNDLGEQLHQKTKAQVVVVTVKTLGGASLEEYALEVLRKWGVGDKELNNGVILLVATQDRKSRIEVGYGLEGALPDAKTGRIQDNYMIPSFKNNDYQTGIVNGYVVLLQEVAKEYGQTIVFDKNGKVAPPAQNDTSWLEYIGMVLFIILIILGRFFGGRGGRGGGYYGGGFGGFGGGGSSGGGGFGGGSGGGGGSSRGW